MSNRLGVVVLKDNSRSYKNLMTKTFSAKCSTTPTIFGVIIVPASSKFFEWERFYLKSGHSNQFRVVLGPHLLKPNVAEIMSFNFGYQIVDYYGAIMVAVDDYVLTGIIFEKM